MTAAAERVRAMPRPQVGGRALAPLSGATTHAVHEIAPGLLLVFKPRGHREDEHAHAHRQRLLVLRGCLAIETARARTLLRPRSGAVVLPAGRRHATEAREDTWLVAEALPAASRGRTRR